MTLLVLTMDTTPMIVTGPPGCGKSHWIQQYAQQIGKQLFVCPCRKDRTLRDGRQKLHVWARRTEPSILWLEGADDLTPEAQAFLRRILETHAAQVLFILECRDAGRLQEPIRSRCRIKKHGMPSREELMMYLTPRSSTEKALEILQYLHSNEQTYRRIQQCLYLQQYHPEQWSHVLAHRIQEQKECAHPSAEKLIHYLQEGYHPDAFLHPMLQDKRIIKDYGTCLEVAGSLWALLGDILERRAFDCDATTTAPKEE